MPSLRRPALLALPVAAIIACSATGENPGATGASTGSGSGSGGGSDSCGQCFGSTFTPCKADGTPGDPVTCPEACAPGKGCTACVPGEKVCIGNEVHKCSTDGTNTDELVEICDVGAGFVCSNGACSTA